MNTGKEKYWIVLAIFVAGLVFFTCAAWILHQPYAISWDEAGYFNRVQADVAAAKTEGVRGLKDVFLHEDTSRPPAYRFAAVPFSYLFGFSPTGVRMVSLAVFLATVIFVYLAASALGDVRTGCLAAILACLSPELVFLDMAFGTEHFLFFATATSLFFLFRVVKKGRGGTLDWLGLGVSFGLGALAKSSFVLIGGPILIAGLVLTRSAAWSRREEIAFFVKVSAVGLLIALPWWVINFRSALAYAHYATGFVRHSAGVTGFALWMRWTNSFAESGLGTVAAAFFILVAADRLIARFLGRTGQGLDRKTRAALWVCFIAPLPVLFAPLFGQNQNFNHASASIVFFVVGIALLAGSRKWTVESGRSKVAAGFVVLQLGLMCVPMVHSGPVETEPMAGQRYPWVVMRHWEQWNWNGLREAAIAWGAPRRPRIAYLGNGSAFNPPQIAYPWAFHGEREPRVRWLWRYEEGALDWAGVMRVAADQDILLTVPGYTGSRGDMQYLDNRYNDEFVHRLEEDPRFAGPYFVSVGTDSPVDAAVFLNRGRFNAPSSPHVQGHGS